MDRTQIYLLICLLFFAMISRLIPHPPNFTSVLSIAVLAPLLFKNVKLSFLSAALPLFISDLLLGAHSTQLFTYGSCMVITAFGHYFKPSKKPMSFFAGSAFLFYAITNFGVWMMTDLYPKTLSGLCLSYTAAFPFLLNQILGTVFYGTLILLCSSLFKSTVTGSEHSIQ